MIDDLDDEFKSKMKEKFDGVLKERYEKSVKFRTESKYYPDYKREPYEDWLGNFWEDSYEVFSLLLKDTGLEHESAYEDGYNYVGASWSSVGDSETGLEFKTRIEKAIANLGLDVKCGTHEEAWRDG